MLIQKLNKKKSADTQQRYAQLNTPGVNHISKTALKWGGGGGVTLIASVFWHLLFGLKYIVLKHEIYINKIKELFDKF